MYYRLWIICYVVLSLACCTVSTATAESPSLRVLTYNIHHGEGVDRKFDYDRLAKVIKDLKPDVVALQEVDNKTGRADGVDQAARLGKMLEMEHVFGKAMHYSGGEYGEAILSRYPIKQTWNHPLPFRVGFEPRAALAVQVDPGEGLPELIFVGTHLCHQSNDIRVEQTKQLNLLYPASGSLPVLLAGDLNSRPGSEPMKELLAERWVDAVAPQSRIDYILYRPDDPWQVREVTIVPDDVTSDHRPVLVVLEWTGKQS